MGNLAKQCSVLIITHAFPPMNSIASHRPYSWARNWSQSGHDINVLTTEKHGFDGTLDLEYETDGFCVHSAPYLPKARNSVGSNIKAGQENIKKWENIKTHTRKIRFGLGMFADLRMVAFRPLVRKGFELINRFKPDFIISTYPPPVVHLAAHRLSSKTGVPWIADYRDSWSDEMRLYQYRLISALEGKINRRLLKRATLISTVSQGIANNFKNILGRQVVVSYNGYANYRQTSHGSRLWDDDKIHLVYTGRVYPGRQDTDRFLRIVGELKTTVQEFDQKISIDFFGHDDNSINSLVEKYSLQSCVSVHGFVPYEKSLRAQKNADALLFFDWTQPSASGMLTGKIFEYLASGKPIVSVGRIKNTEAAELIRNSRSGSILTEAEEIKSYLMQFLQGMPDIDPDKDFISSFSREKQAKRLLNDIKSHLNQ